ncbi:MAG: type II toxin-antitoxin system prevent-host-death family antitoxin [Proteobacteria bacterium]|nr:type II toxin-antitoxin system prevent-host-death family antitoxin [Pseudomonadota bacterium]MBS0463780.1 type II toxin-antitoxin system prevent-host-death family antitoxin [Pseudomonadota bacterium]
MTAVSRKISKGVEEARRQLPAILTAAAAGHTTLITRRGRTVAAVVPADQVRAAKPVSLHALAGTGRGLWGRDSRRTIDDLRAEWSR